MGQHHNTELATFQSIRKQFEKTFNRGGAWWVVFRPNGFIQQPKGCERQSNGYMVVGGGMGWLDQLLCCLVV